MPVKSKNIRISYEKEVLFYIRSIHLDLSKYYEKPY